LNSSRKHPFLYHLEITCDGIQLKPVSSCSSSSGSGSGSGSASSASSSFLIEWKYILGATREEEHPLSIVDTNEKKNKTNSSQTETDFLLFTCLPKKQKNTKNKEKKPIKRILTTWYFRLAAFSSAETEEEQQQQQQQIGNRLVQVIQLLADPRVQTHFSSKTCSSSSIAGAARAGGGSVCPTTNAAMPVSKLLASHSLLDLLGNKQILPKRVSFCFGFFCWVFVWASSRLIRSVMIV
jgi:hypothetical protein